MQGWFWTSWRWKLVYNRRGSETFSGSHELPSTTQAPLSWHSRPYRIWSHHSSSLPWLLSHPHQIELSSSSYIPSHALPSLIWIPLSWMFWSPSENLQTLLSFEGQGQIFVLPQAFVTKVTSSLSEFSQSEKWGPLVHAIVLCVSYLPEAEIRAVVSERYPEHVFRTSGMFKHQSSFEKIWYLKKNLSI